MAKFDFFRPTSAWGSHTRIRQFVVKSSPTGFLQGEPVIVASGLMDVSGSNPSTVSLLGIAMAQSSNVDGTQPTTATTLRPVAVKNQADEWVCHNFGGSSGTGAGVAPTVALCVGVQMGIIAGTFTYSATDVRYSASTLTLASAFSVDTGASAKHFEGVRVLDSLFRDIAVSGGTGEYVVVRWLANVQ